MSGRYLRPSRPDSRRYQAPEHLGSELLDTLSCPGRYPQSAFGGDAHVSNEIGLVEDREDLGEIRSEILQNLLAYLLLLGPLGMTTIDHVQYQIGEGDFLEGAPEGGHQVMGKLADESDGIREDSHRLGVQRPSTELGIESRKELVFHSGPCLRQSIERSLST